MQILKYFKPEQTDLSIFDNRFTEFNVLEMRVAICILRPNSYVAGIKTVVAKSRNIKVQVNWIDLRRIIKVNQYVVRIVLLQYFIQLSNMGINQNKTPILKIRFCSLEQTLILC